MKCVCVWADKLPRSRVLEHPATHDGGLQRGRDPRGTAGLEPEDTLPGNLDIRIPVAEKRTGRPWKQEDNWMNKDERMTPREKRSRTRELWNPETDKAKNPMRRGAARDS
ncbi:hypothetical protein NDU88_010988 [Pleurodeles waltl]|uniref:Uncharacterized protein n=1 Tax=Pleurodeles waltl TaxID=8319 RepID=A0AAV7QW91_PLEWA|nr:hypothetical protein NDU88_010988 [Pleurodeles waltl]